MCEVDQRRLNADFVLRCGMLPFECQLIRALLYCSRLDNTQVTLTEEALVTMVENKWCDGKRKSSLIQRQCEGKGEGAVQLTVVGPSTKFIFREVSYYSRLGSVVTAYDGKLNTWHCRCLKARQSCIHKAVGKWHLFVTKRILFWRVKTTEEGTVPPQHTRTGHN